MTQHSQQCWDILLLHFVCLVHRLHKSSDNLKAYIEYKISFLSPWTCKELFVGFCDCWASANKAWPSTTGEMATRHFSDSLCYVLTAFMLAFQRKKALNFPGFICVIAQRKWGKIGFVLPVVCFFRLGHTKIFKASLPVSWNVAKEDFRSPLKSRTHVSGEAMLNMCYTGTAALQNWVYHGTENGKELSSLSQCTCCFSSPILPKHV